MITFVGVDPSLANTAIVWGTIEGDKVYPEDYMLITTTKNTNKSIRVSSDTVARCRETLCGLNKIINKVKPNMAFCETPSGSQSSKAMLSYGVSCAYIASIKPPPIEVTPMEVKKATVGKKTASKKEMMDWAENTFPNFPFERKKDGTMVVGRMEHVADALATVVAGMKTTQFEQLDRLIK